MATMTLTEHHVAQQLAVVRAEMDAEIAAATAANARLEAQLEGLLISNAVREAAGAGGVKPGAVDDVIGRAAAMFRVADGAVVAKDAAKLVSPAEWVAGLSASAPHLFHAGAISEKSEADAADGRRRFIGNVEEIAAGRMKAPVVVAIAPKPAARVSNGEFLANVETIAAGPAL